MEATSREIPLLLFQSWKTLDLSPHMRVCVEQLKQQNPEFEHRLFDDSMCRDFITHHFPMDVVDAFDDLAPGAYKCDLWRYCVLYIHGGVYLDIKYQPEPDFRLIDLCDRERFVLEKPNSYRHRIEFTEQTRHQYYTDPKNIDWELWKNGIPGIYNGFMICKPTNPILKQCIDRIVIHVKQKNYTTSPYYITGPGLLGTLYQTKEHMDEFDLYYCLFDRHIFHKNRSILSIYDTYREEQKAASYKNHYLYLYSIGDVYHTDKIKGRIRKRK